jgi:hypothetical protein
VREILLGNLLRVSKDIVTHDIQPPALHQVIALGKSSEGNHRAHSFADFVEEHDVELVKGNVRDDEPYGDVLAQFGCGRNISQRNLNLAVNIECIVVKSDNDITLIGIVQFLKTDNLEIGRVLLLCIDICGYHK